ncbi:uncharacterized membrane protein YsdA (DUF1294 family) [Paraburkholderia youngii]|uniref:hypothetical protein n=2 Tax=Paraburkholderia youngii TaxID=2782701 RepID=UPI003D20A99D
MLARGAFRIDQLGLSLLAVVPALAGMWLGSIVRQKISPKTFRRCFLLFLIVQGSRTGAASVRLSLAKHLLAATRKANGKSRMKIRRLRYA